MSAPRRMGALVAALLIEALLLLALLFMTPSAGGPKGERRAALTVVSIAPPSQPAHERAAPQQNRAAARRTETPPPQPAAPPANTQAPPAVSPPPQPAPAAPQAPPAETQAPAAPRQVYGPPAPGADPNDTPIVGTAPNGEPLYAAAWYREPYDDELRGYLSTAQGPGWALIACRTVPDFRVEDCVGLGEQPEGSNIQRAVLAAAWQFKVRPPRRGGRSLVGSWVRIRIDYIERRATIGGGPSRR